MKLKSQPASPPTPRDYSTPGLGVDIDPSLVSEATVLALDAGVAELVDFRLEDVGLTDLDKATAIVSFLVPRQLKLLQPKLLKFLARGGKLACYHYRWRGEHLLETGRQSWC